MKNKNYNKIKAIRELQEENARLKSQFRDAREFLLKYIHMYPSQLPPTDNVFELLKLLGGDYKDVYR